MNSYLSLKSSIEEDSWTTLTNSNSIYRSIQSLIYKFSILLFIINIVICTRYIYCYVRKFSRADKTNFMNFVIYMLVKIMNKRVMIVFLKLITLLNHEHSFNQYHLGLESTIYQKIRI